MHPINGFMEKADRLWQKYDEDRSTTFRETVTKYRRRYGRHPPPGFKDWYQFARRKNVHNIDDFEQVMDDLRPFWSLEPKVIRQYAAHMWEREEDGIAGLHIRDKKVVRLTFSSWRSETLKTLIDNFVEFLPDMDIAMNRLDQPRVVVPWDDMQEMLAKELETRQIPPEATDNFTMSQSDLLDIELETGGGGEMEDPAWFHAPGQQYMKIASLACPPESPARDNETSISEADTLYKTSGGIVTNFNLSSDLCTIGPNIEDKHGFLYSASSIIASKKLLPVFGECKVNVNSDILFPANMYYRHDDRYDYDPMGDLDWEDKAETMVWRGVTSGGVQIAENWQTMHRQRLVQLLNSTHMAHETVSILAEDTSPSSHGTYTPFHSFQPSLFASQHTDVGFTESWGCVPNCDFYADVWTYKPQIPLTRQFESKYLIDVDGHSFSGRWRAFLESKSLGFKATIFREWHDSRLFAWRHFVPVDNRYDDLYSLLTYFVGVGTPGNTRPEESEDNYVNGDAYVPRHDLEAKRIARQGREWANKVLRRDDIEIYMFRLLIEYARIVDDNRDRIGYSGDGAELDHFDSEAVGNSSKGGFGWGLPDLGG